jgi:hypothetical protein
MVAIINPKRIEEDFLAHVTDIAYQAVLRQGLRHSFLDVELTLWQQIRSAYHARRAESVSLEGDR